MASERSLADDVVRLAHFCLTDSGEKKGARKSAIYIGSFIGEQGHSAFFYDYDRRCISEIGVEHRTCKRVYRIPITTGLIPGIGGCCCFSSGASRHPSGDDKCNNSSTTISSNKSGRRQTDALDVVFLLPEHNGIRQFRSIGTRDDAEYELLESSNHVHLSGEIWGLFPLHPPHFIRSNPCCSPPFCVAIYAPESSNAESSLDEGLLKRDASANSHVACAVINCLSCTILCTCELPLQVINKDDGELTTHDIIPVNLRRQKLGKTFGVYVTGVAAGCRRILMEVAFTHRFKECCRPQFVELLFRQTDLVHDNCRESRGIDDTTGYQCVENNQDKKPLLKSLSYHKDSAIATWKLFSCSPNVLEQPACAFSSAHACKTKCVDWPLALFSDAEKGEYQLLAMGAFPTSQFSPVRRYRAVLGTNKSTVKKGALLLTENFFLEWSLSEENDAVCHALLRETHHGTPCSPLYRVDCSRCVTARPTLLGSRHGSAASSANLLFACTGAYYLVPIPLPTITTRRLVGSFAVAPVTPGLDEETFLQRSKADVLRRHGLLLQAAGVVDGRALDLAVLLLSVEKCYSLRTSGSGGELRIPKDWFSSTEEREETEKALSLLIRKQVVPLPASLIAFIIANNMESAAKFCCESALLQERELVCFLSWKPTVLFSFVLKSSTKRSKSLLLRALQELLAKGRKADTAAVTSMLQQLYTWLKHYCSACTQEDNEAANKEVQKEDPPSLYVVLDFIALLVDAKIPAIFMERGEDSVLDEESEERRLFVKILKRVQRMLEFMQGPVLRRVEGRIFAALSTSHTISPTDMDIESQLIRSFSIYSQ